MGTSYSIVKVAPVPQDAYERILHEDGKLTDLSHRMLIAQEKYTMCRIFHPYFFWVKCYEQESSLNELKMRWKIQKHYVDLYYFSNRLRITPPK